MPNVIRLLVLFATIIALPCWAQNLPSVTDSAGRKQSATGVSCVDPTTGVPVLCGNGTDPNNASYQGSVAMVLDTPVAAQRGFGTFCTAAGNVSVTFVDNSTLVFFVVAGFQTFPFAVTAVNSSGTTATCTYVNLK